MWFRTSVHFLGAVCRPSHGHGMTRWAVIYWETLSFVNLSSVPIKEKIKPMRNYGLFCYLCAAENPGFHCGEKYSVKQWYSNSHKCMIWLPERRARQLQQADLQHILQTFCTELVRAISPNSTSLCTWNERKSRPLRQDTGNESVCYFSGILACFFFPPQPMGHLLKHSGCPAWLKCSQNTNCSDSYVEDTGKGQNNFGSKYKCFRVFWVMVFIIQELLLSTPCQ